MIFVYTSRLNNTHRFVRRVSPQITPRPLTVRIPWSTSDQDRPSLLEALDYAQAIDDDVVLVVPSYRRYNESQLGLSYVPLPIERFLLHKESVFSSRVVGVVGTGNMTFGPEFCRAGEELSELLEVPLVSKVDMSGSELDDERVVEFLRRLPAGGAVSRD